MGSGDSGWEEKVLLREVWESTGDRERNRTKKEFL